MIAQLLALASQSRLPQSLLLYGPAPMAVEKSAHDFLMSLFCQTSNACRQCAECRSFLIGEHPEVFHLTSEAGAAIKIADVRSAMEHLGWHSSVRADGRKSWRVVWLSQAENLTEQAANAILKTVEEPPEGALILVTARHPRNLLPTLRSRLLALRIQGHEPVVGISSDMHAAINELLCSRGAAETLFPAEQIARQGRMKAGEFAAGVELVLNDVYREVLFEKHVVPHLVDKIAARRRTLMELHQLARRKRVALNTQLAAEMTGAALEKYL